MKKVYSVVLVCILIMFSVNLKVYGESPKTERFYDNFFDISNYGIFEWEMPKEDNFFIPVKEENREKVSVLIDDYVMRLTHPEYIKDDKWNYFLKDGYYIAGSMGDGMLHRIKKDRTVIEFMKIEDIGEIFDIDKNWIYYASYGVKEGNIMKMNLETMEEVSLFKGRFYILGIKNRDIYYYIQHEKDDKSYYEVWKYTIGNDKPEVVIEKVNHVYGEEAEDLISKRKEMKELYKEEKNRLDVRREELDKRLKIKFNIDREKIFLESIDVRIAKKGFVDIQKEDVISNVIGEDEEYLYYHDGIVCIYEHYGRKIILQRKKCNIYREAKKDGEVERLAKDVVFTVPEYSYYEDPDKVIEDIKSMDKDVYLGEFKYKTKHEAREKIKEIFKANKESGKKYRIKLNIDNDILTSREYFEIMRECCGAGRYLTGGAHRIDKEYIGDINRNGTIMYGYFFWIGM